MLLFFLLVFSGDHKIINNLLLFKIFTENYKITSRVSGIIASSWLAPVAPIWPLLNYPEIGFPKRFSLRSEGLRFAD